MNRANAWRWVLSLAVGLVGCASRGPAVDPAGLKLSAVTTDGLEIPAPVVEVKDTVMHVSGYVRRVPGNTAAVEGRVTVDFLAADGSPLDNLSILLSPAAIPDDPRQASTYDAYYGYIPPAGSTVRVRFVDKVTAARINSGDVFDSDDTTRGGYVNTGGHGPTINGHPGSLVNVNRASTTVNHRR